MKLTIGEAREFVRARLDELAAQESDMLLSAIDDRNLDNTVDKLIEEAISYIHLAAPASLMEGPILTESNFAEGDLVIKDRVLDIDTALSDINDDILRFISFQCGDSDIKLTRAFYEDSPEARMQLNEYIQGQPDSPALVKMDDSPDYRPHFKYYTTDMCLDGIGRALHFVLRYFARPKPQGGTISVSPSVISLGAGINSKTVTVNSTKPWRLISTVPDWLWLSETEGTESATITISVQQNRGSQRSVSLVFTNDDGTATLEATQKGYSSSEGDERLKVASTALINGVMTLPSTDISNVYYLRVAAEEQLAWTAVLSDTENFFISPTNGIGTGIENYSSVAVYALRPNDTGVARTATVTFMAAGVNPVVITLRQPTQLTVTPRSVGVSSAAGSQIFQIATEGAWETEIMSAPVGFNLSQVSGNGNATILAVYPANDTGELRLINFLVKSGGASMRVIINQAAASQSSIGVNPTALGPFPANGDITGRANTINVSASGGEWAIDSNTLPSWASVVRNPRTENQIAVANVNANNTTQPRSQTIVVYLVSDPTKTASFIVSQEGQQSSITILDSIVPLDNVTVPYSGGTFSATLNATGPWQLTSSKSWLHITSATTGQAGTHTVTFRVDSGQVADSAEITGALTDGSNKTCSYYIIREGAPVVEDYISATRRDNPMYNDTTVTNGEDNEGFDVQASGPWVAVAQDSWIHPITSYGSWSGNGGSSVKTCWFYTDVNTGGQRTGRILASLTGTDKTATFYVYQEGDGRPTLSASFNKTLITASSQKLYLKIATQSSIVWSIDQVSSGLTPAKYTGVGPDEVEVNVGAYSGEYSRTLSLRVRNASYNLTSSPNVKQDPPSAPSTWLLMTPNSRKDIPYSQVSQTITIDSNVSWSASCDAAGVTLSPSSGTNRGTIVASFGQNTDPVNSRPMRITVTGGGHTAELYLVQAKKAADPLVVNPMAVQIPATGGQQLVTVDTFGNWGLTKSESWIQTSVNAGTLTPATSFYISAQANTGSARTGYVTVSGNGATKTIEVTQGSAANLAISSELVSLLKAANSTGSVYVYAQDMWEVDEEMSNIPVWLEYIYSTHAGSQNGETLTFLANAENNTGFARDGLIRLRLVNSPDVDPVTITVRQSAGSTLTVTPLNTTALATPDEGTIDIESNTDWYIVPGSISSGLTFDGDDMSGSGDKSDVLWQVTGNPLLEQRELMASFRTEDGSITRLFKVTQAAGTFEVSPTSVSFAGSGESITVRLRTSSGWSIVSKPSWITARAASVIPDPSGLGVTLSASANNSAAERNGQVIFQQNTYGHQATVNVTQSAGLTLHTLEISPSEDVHLESGDATTVEIAVTSDTNWQVDLSKCFSGTTCSPMSGTGDATLTLSIPVGSDSLRRHVFGIKTTDNAIAKQLNIWQPASNDDITFEPDVSFITFSEDSPSADVIVMSNRNWTAESTGAWLQFEPISGNAWQPVTVRFRPRLNQTKAQRATWKVTTEGGAQKSITCTSQPTMAPLPDSLEGERQNYSYSTEIII